MMPHLYSGEIFHIILERRFSDAGDLALVCQLTEADTADAVVAQIRMGTAADLAAVVSAGADRSYMPPQTRPANAAYKQPTERILTCVPAAAADGGVCGIMPAGEVGELFHEFCRFFLAYEVCRLHRVD